jgi:hypothetical protein
MMPRRCCEKDTDGDGNCPIHIAPGMLRESPYKGGPTFPVPEKQCGMPPCLSCIDQTHPIFVFGSNMAGRHGRGAALHALQHHAAVYGQGEGRQGNSYAIPTLDHTLKNLPFGIVARFCEDFVVYAEDHQDLRFFLTAVGTGLAGIPVERMKAAFRDCPLNVIRPEGW